MCNIVPRYLKINLNILNTSLIIDNIVNDRETLKLNTSNLPE